MVNRHDGLPSGHAVQPASDEPRIRITRSTGRVARPRDVRVRGQAFRSLLGAISATFSPDELNEVLARLSGETRRYLPGDMASTTWYPVTWYADLHRAAREVKGAGRDLPRMLGREARRLDSRGLYRFILRFASPELLVRHADSVHALYVEGPTLAVSTVQRDEDEAFVTFEVEGAAGYDQNVWEEVNGSLEWLFETSGALGVRASVIDGGERDWMTGEVRWVINPGAHCA